jgi:urease accessory protein
MREGGPTIFAQVKKGKGVENIISLIISAWRGSGAEAVSKERGGLKPTTSLEELT